MSIFNDRLTNLENGDTIIRPNLIASYFLTGGGVLLAAFLLLSIINNAKFNIYIIFMFLMMGGCFYLGWHNRYRSFIKLENNFLKISSYRLKSIIISKEDIIEISSFEKGCSFFITISDGRNIKFDDYDSRLLAREIKKWMKLKKKN